VLENLNFVLEHGEFISIVGPSGCGKSTILNLISGLLKACSGEVKLNGRTLNGISNKVGYMLQHDHLFEWRTIWQNIMLGLQVQKKVDAESKDYAKTLLERYNLAEFKDYYPRQLSGGMRQRVALIRTLVLKPDLLLLDEPFSALDYQNRLKLSDDVFNMIEREKKTAILVTHDIAESISLSDRVLVLSGRPSRVTKQVNTNLRSLGTPLKRRKAPAFQMWFNEIWQSMQNQ